MLLPKNADIEAGFQQWVNKIKVLSKQSGADIVFYGTPICNKKLKELFNKTKPDTATKFLEFKDWANFLTVAKEVKEDDLFVIVSARRDTVSYQSNMENLPLRLARNFPQTSFIVLYPHQRGVSKGNNDFYQSQEYAYNSYINNPY